MLLALMLLFSLCMQAQMNNLMNRAKAKVQNRVNQRVDQAMDKALDDLENPQASKAANKPAQKPAPQPAASKTASKENEEEAPAEAAQPKVVSYSKFDFVPGERVIYAEDFAQDAIGELPLTWNSSGKGEVMTLNSQQGKWLRIFENNTYLSGNTKGFGDNYTIEFDLMFYFEPKVKGYVLPGWSFGLFSSGGEDPGDNKFLQGQTKYASSEVHFGFGSYALAWVQSHVKNSSTFYSDKMELGEPQAAFNKVVHYSAQVQKSRLRVWVNERKVFDIPRAMSTADTINQIFFHLEGSNYKEDEIGLFVSNIKVATGLPDTRHKLVEEGKFSTTGILFDFQSAVIKPESYGVIREVANVLKENPSLNIKVIGHTSSDGDDAANMELSKQRAAAVKELMLKEYGIEAGRLASEGKGETAPIADNKTKEGKVQNRRVEFVKM